jgi:molybdopterin biosynthesis enzyme
MFAIVDRPLTIRAQLELSIATDPSLEHRIPVQLIRRKDGLIARPLLGSSSQLHILAFADAIVVVPEGSSGLKAGALIDTLPFSRTRML